MSFSDYLADKLNDHIFRGVAYTRPTTIYVGLIDAVTSVEYSGNGYARIELPTLPARNANEVGGVRNTSPLTWPAPTGYWGKPFRVAFFDAASGGNELARGAFGILSGADHLTRWVGNRGFLTIQFPANPSNGDTLVIDSITYTFKTTLAAAYDVKIGTNQDDTAANLIFAINDSGGSEGTDYGTGTDAHPTIEAINFTADLGDPFYQGFEFLNTYSVVLRARSSLSNPTGNGISATLSSDALFFDRSISGTDSESVAETSGGGVAFSIPKHGLSVQFQDGSDGGVTDYLANKLFDWIYRGVDPPFPVPTGHVVALYTTAPASDGTGGVEVIDGGYTRQPLTMGAYDTTFNRARNSVAVVFGVAVGAYTIKAVMVLDGAGNPLIRNVIFGAGTNIPIGDQARFDPTNSGWIQVNYI